MTPTERSEREVVASQLCPYASIDEGPCEPGYCYSCRKQAEAILSALNAHRKQQGVSGGVGHNPPAVTRGEVPVDPLPDAAAAPKDTTLASGRVEGETSAAEAPAGSEAATERRARALAAAYRYDWGLCTETDKSQYRRIARAIQASDREAGMVLVPREAAAELET